MSKGKKGSMKYQVAHARNDVCASEKTNQQYKNHTIKYAEWCKATYGVKDFENCKGYVQAYCDFLVERDKSAHTIHTYLAGICHYFGIPLKSIKKPKRINAKNKRSRGAKACDSRSDTKRERSPRLYDFAAKVGVRRAEYAQIADTDLVFDESGKPCIRIRKGKGGKYQLQRILPEDYDFLKQEFGATHCVLFEKSELKNKIDLHALRGAQARRAYAHYLERIRCEGREPLIEEIKRRWVKYNRKEWDERIVREAPYRLRGANKQLAIDNGLPVVYDRLALMAVSVFHLSHWRLDVSVSNYLLAIN